MIGSGYWKAIGLAALALIVAGLTPAHAAVFQTKQECRYGFWHVVTYDITDPFHPVEVEDIPTSLPCGGGNSSDNPGPEARKALEYPYQDRDGSGKLVIVDGVANLGGGPVPIDVLLYQNGHVFEGAGTRQLIYQTPPEVSDGFTVYQLAFTLGDRFGRLFSFQGQLQIGGFLGFSSATGGYQRVGGGDSGPWQIAAGPPRPLKAHIHPPVNWLGGCSWLGHDPGCAALGPEYDCELIIMGVNKGKYLCLH
jgi:hypothetical protein